ncbi:MAG: hypothetical protein EOO39_01425 [Cytophagaceae bacterium]|nr:MAG: hypothetical protein EOO39_01425 [Cytophagaceae bacterium]
MKPLVLFLALLFSGPSFGQSIQKQVTSLKIRTTNNEVALDNILTTHSASLSNLAGKITQLESRTTTPGVGPKGDAGSAATVILGTVTPLPPGSTPTITPTGSGSALVLNFGIPTTATLTVGNVTTVAYGISPSITTRGTSPNLILDFAIPRGKDGVDGIQGPAGSGSGADYAGKALVIVDFNSLGAGRGSSHEISNPDDYAPGPFPVTMMNSLTATFPSAIFARKNFSVSGRQTPTMIANSTQVDALFDASIYDRQVIVSGEITNHIADGGATAQQAIDSYVSYCKSRRVKGFLVVATTVLPRISFFGSGISASEFESRRQVVNTYIRANYLQFADVLADIASLTSLTYPDGTHTNDAGYVIIGNYIAGKVAPLLRTGFNPQSIAFLLSGTTSGPGSGTTTSPGGSTTAASGTYVLNLRGQGSNNSTAFTDESGHTITGSGNAKISTAQFKFGTSSIYLDGSPSTYINAGNSADYNLGVGDFTIEMWLYKTSNGSGYPGLVARGDNTTNQWAWVFPNAGTKPELFVSSGGYQAQNLNATLDVPLNQWVHLALVSSGGVRKLYQNGTLSGTASGTLNMESNATGKNLYVGYLPAVGGSDGDVLTGYLHVRVAKSALYTGTFTPPTSF